MTLIQIKILSFLDMFVLHCFYLAVPLPNAVQLISRLFSACFELEF
jgi:hypothetical protein